MHQPTMAIGNGCKVPFFFHYRDGYNRQFFFSTLVVFLATLGDTISRRQSETTIANYNGGDYWF